MCSWQRYPADPRGSASPRRSGARGTGALGFALALSLLAGRARAAGEAERQAAAQALFEAARQLTQNGRFAEACPMFAESQRLDPSIGTQFYLAECLEHEGKLASAWSNYLEVADRARSLLQSDRETFARQRAEALRARLPKVTMSVPEALKGTPDLEVRRGESLVGAAQWGAPIPVDPAIIVVSASAPGKNRWESTVDARQEGATVTVVIPVLSDALRTRSEGPRPIPLPILPGQPRSDASGATARRPSTWQRTAGIVAGAAGLAGLGVGAGFGALAIAKQRESYSNDHCTTSNLCDDAGLALRRDGITAATVSTVAFIAGGAAVVAGGVLVFTAPPPCPPRESRASVIAPPRVILGLGRLAVEGTF